MSYLCTRKWIQSSTSHITSSKLLMKSGSTFPYQVRVAYQGEPGAYSEKATRELLGQRVITVPYESFEDAFKAVASREVDYAVVPIENSLGGSIHTNFDLLLRYDLNIIAEHEFRVEHSLLALPGVDKKDIKKVMSHPQALAQCDNYLRNWGVSRESTYDTAGSAKMIKEKNLKDCAAIASDLAGATYGMNVLDSNIEDDDNNYTRFLLLSRLSVSSLIPPSMPAKTSIVYLLPNNPGALYKALACFSLRDIDCCKIESRPTSVQLLQFLNSNKIKNSITQLQSASQDLPRFQYTFYLDYLASEFDDVSQSALNHLKEQSQFVRVLGSYPKGGQLIGPIKAALEDISQQPLRDNNILLTPYIPKRPLQKRLKIGIVGFGKFGQFLAKTFVKNHDVYCVSKDDRSVEAKQLGCVDFFPLYDLSSFTKIDFDVIVLAVSIISFEDVVRSLPRDFLRNRLVVDVLSVKSHAKEIMLDMLPPEADILCTHPMFGPESGMYGWQGLPFVYDKVRVEDVSRCEQFLSIWETERCKMIDMTCELHDEFAANSQFITHLIGRILWQQNLVPTPIDTKGFQTVLNLVDNTCKDSFDLFFGLYHYNKYATKQLQNIREALSQVERALAAKEAYLSAKAEITNEQRNRIVDECRRIMIEVMQDSVTKYNRSNAIDEPMLPSDGDKAIKG